MIFPSLTWVSSAIKWEYQECPPPRAAVKFQSVALCGAYGRVLAIEGEVKVLFNDLNDLWPISAEVIGVFLGYPRMAWRVLERPLRWSYSELFFGGGSKLQSGQIVTTENGLIFVTGTANCMCPRFVFSSGAHPVSTAPLHRHSLPPATPHPESSIFHVLL